MNVILFVFVMANGIPQAVQPSEFLSQELCDNAGRKVSRMISQTTSGYHNVAISYECVPKRIGGS